VKDLATKPQISMRLRFQAQPELSNWYGYERTESSVRVRSR
jgi:hypothetical protein